MYLNNIKQNAFKGVDLEYLQNYRDVSIEDIIVAQRVNDEKTRFVYEVH